MKTKTTKKAPPKKDKRQEIEELKERAVRTGIAAGGAFAYQCGHLAP